MQDPEAFAVGWDFLDDISDNRSKALEKAIAQRLPSFRGLPCRQTSEEQAMPM
jgi:hypothetical protein